MGVAVIGGGIQGLVSAYVLAKAGVNVVVYEKEEQVGGHAKTVSFDAVDLDLGLLFLNPARYPTMLELFDSLEVDVEATDVSFSVSHDKGNGYEWCSQYGFSNFLAHKKKMLNPYNWQDLRETIKFGNDVNSYLESLEKNPDIDRNETLGHFVGSKGYSENFLNTYLAPICGSMWSCSKEEVMSFSAYSILSFCRTYHLYQLFGNPQWLTIKRHSYLVKKVRDILESRGCQFKLGCEVLSVLPADDGSSIVFGDGFQETYNGCIMAVNAPTALKILGNQATFEEMRVLGAFQYASSDIYLHRDSNLMPTNRSGWSALNFLRSRENKASLTYWLNVLQNVGKTSQPFFVTLNPDRIPDKILLKWSTGRPIPSVAASKASLELDQIQGKRGIWFCGYDFHEDELKAGMDAAHRILGKHFSVLHSPRQMSPSFMETTARLLVTKFFHQYIQVGCVIIIEEGGRVYTFKGSMENCSLKTALKVHNPQFYWRIMKEADIGLADAYIQGDFSFVDKDDGLLNLFRILIANKELNSASGQNKRRTWLSPALFTAGISSAKYFLKHYMRQNTVTQARRNISRHYDLSNELFTLYLGEMMQYSSGIFKTGEEHLDVAQRRKISSLIDKSRIEKWHEVLDIGCGWGSLAMEVVKRTGCKYTGITLSEQQLKYAEEKVKEAGLQGNIKFLLCDYRQLPKTFKYDRIISVEMVEHVGEEYIEEFFRCCDSLLAENGLFVLQFISIPEILSKEIQQTAGFLKEYIFPGGTLLSLDRTLSAMAAASRFSVEHVENIGISYYHTLRWWRKNFLANESKVLALGFDEKFMRTWEYYFDYCAAGFKTGTLIDYQVVFSRAGNFAALGDPYIGFPSAYSYSDN
uniref:Cyclopropane synthase n=1 Tax=Sterculia foetida TaxID=195802 RepID=Q8LSD5_9ROSI|nr:cyclopropane synthase [Sterculia foetida]